MKSKKNADINLDEVKKKLKQFKKDIKDFKKKSKDFKEGLEISKKLIEDINYFNKLKKFKPEDKVLKKLDLNKFKDSLLLYNENVSNILEFKNKYDKKKGVRK